MTSILVVDDELNIRFTLQKILKQEGYDVYLAQDSLEAVQYLNQISIDIILCDIVLPEISGIELLEFIKEQSPRSIIIMMTGDPTLSSAIGSLRKGVFDYLTKPISRDMILTTVAKAVHLKTLEDEKKRLEIENFNYQKNLEQLVEEKTQELRKSEEKYRILIEHTSDIVWQIDLQGRITYVSPSVQRITGYKPEEMIDQPVDLFLNKDSRKRFQESLQKRIQGQLGKQDIRMILTMKNKNGSAIYTEVQSTPVFDPNDKLESIIGVARDVTERKEQEKKIRESEYLYRELVDNMSSGVAVYEAVDDGQDFVFKDINKAGARIGQIKKEDHLGKSVLQVYPGIKEFGLFEVLQKVWRTGESCYHPVTLYRDKRVAIWIDNYVFQLPSGEIIAIYNDVSEKQKAKQELIESNIKLRELSQRLSDIQESERKEIARDLHDHVGQTLTALNMNLNLIQNEIDKIPRLQSLHDRLDIAIHQLETTADNIRNTMANLRPTILDDYGLYPALKWLAESLSKNTALTAVLTGTKPLTRPDSNTETALFRIAQEACNNALKYAKATLLTLSLDETEREWILTVQDNGVGFDLEKVIRQNKKNHWGLMIMKERCKAIDASFQIHTNFGEGAKVEVKVSKKRKSFPRLHSA